MKPKNCPQCGLAMNETLRSCNLMNIGEWFINIVTLNNIQMNQCPCGESIIAIPQVEELYKLLYEHPDVTQLTYENKWRILS